MTWRATENDTLTDSVEYLDASYSSFSYPFIAPGNIIDNNGRPFNYAPHWSANLGYNHVFALASGATLVGAVDTHISTSQWIGYSYVAGSGQQTDYTRTDLSLTYNSPGERWYVSGWAKNLENVAVRTNAAPDLPGSTVDATGQALQWSGIQPPRTFGFTGGFKF